MKKFFYERLPKHNLDLTLVQLEKKKGKRIPDVYLELKSGKKIAIEVQHSQLTKSELFSRTRELNQRGLYVLWVLNGLGNCVEDEKHPLHRKNLRISHLEKALHQMYGGRVYYLNARKDSMFNTTSNLFAMHYSRTEEWPNFVRWRQGSFYCRNSNCVEVRDLSLLCCEFNGLKLARFYDKNFKSSLKESLLNSVMTYKGRYPKNYRSKNATKRLLKALYEEYKDIGKPLLLEYLASFKDYLPINAKLVEKRLDTTNLKLINLDSNFPEKKSGG